MAISDICACSGSKLQFSIPNRRFRGHGSSGSKIRISNRQFRDKIDRSCPPRTLILCSSAVTSTGNESSDSYLEMWKRAMERERNSQIFVQIAETPAIDEEKREEDQLKSMTDRFNQILGVAKEERDRVQRLQVVDRAAAAIAAARALIKESPSSKGKNSVNLNSDGENASNDYGNEDQMMETTRIGSGEVSRTSPGPDFWSWSPPEDLQSPYNNAPIQTLKKGSPFLKPTISLLERENPDELLSIPFESALTQSQHAPPLPPLQSLVEVDNEREEDTLTTDESEHEDLSARNAVEISEALATTHETSTYGINPDGTRWWKESGFEERPDGVVCRWTLIRGVSADGAVEWEDKFWEAADEFDYKELGSEKSGRDAYGNVWREFWKETISQDLSCGMIRMEKTADKWGKNGAGDEWHEKWSEGYDATGRTEKWAHKWCSIDPTTPLDAGHAHVWHERWGENYDGEGGSSKYSDKWAERAVGDGWAKWGDKWDENFDKHGNGIKQGETWWAGEDGNAWNRTWGEHHNGSGWIHKYGKSSSGEHWDTHVQENTWYEKYPHFGFSHCLRNSVQLMAVRKPSPPES